MFRKLITAAFLTIFVTASAAYAEEGYIFQLKEDAVVSASLTEGVESVVSHDAIYRADSLEEVYRFADRSMIKYIGKEARFYLYEDGNSQYSEPNDTYFKKYQWNLPMINIFPVWQSGYYGQDATIGVIDSGLNLEHEDIDKNRVIRTYNVFDESEDVTDFLGYDENGAAIGHGTFVTGIISAQTNNRKGIAGIADKADLVIVKAFDDSDHPTTTSELIKAIDYIDELGGVDVINMSLGTTDDIEEGTKQLFYEAIDKLVKKGVIVVAAVGNDGNTELSYPAAFDNVIGVGGVAKNKKKCDFSQMNESVYVVAPGGLEHTFPEETLDDDEDGAEDETGFIISLSNVENDGDSVSGGSGTSFATPHVAAVAAIAKSICPSMTCEQFKTILQNTSEDLGEEGYDVNYGYGLIDAEKIVKEAQRLTEVVPPGETEFDYDPDNYKTLNYDETTGNILIETSDSDAIVYAAQFEGLALTSLKLIKLADKKSDNGVYEIPLDMVPTKLFLWHGTQSCISPWENKNYVRPTQIPTPEPTLAPTVDPEATPTPTPVPTAEPTPEPTPEPTATPYPCEAAEERIIALINERRVNAGVPALIRDDAGMQVSRRIAIDMLENKYTLSNLTGKDRFDKHPSEYISELTQRSTNVLPICLNGVYRTTADNIVLAMFDETKGGNPKTMLSTEYTHIGVGEAKSAPDEENSKGSSVWLINLFYYY